MQRAIVISLLFLVLVAAGAAVKSSVSALRDISGENWVAYAAYLSVPLLLQLAMIIPGFVIGYFYGHRHIILIAFLGAVAYSLRDVVGSYVYYAINPPQMIDGFMRLPNQLEFIDAVAGGLGSVVLSVVAFLAGAFVKDVREHL